MGETQEPKDIFDDFDPELFKAPPKRTWLEHIEKAGEILDRTELLCPYYPKACRKVDTSQCDKTCEKHPENFIEDENIRQVFDREPWSNWCFTCGEFIPSRNHEPACEPPGTPYSHTVATGLAEYREKITKWVMERMTGHPGI